MCIPKEAWVFCLGIMLFATGIGGAQASDATPKRIVALGDSLTAGYGLESGQDLPSRITALLVAASIPAHVENAGVSGDTTAGGLARLEWAIGGTPKPDLVMVALGANDMLRGLPPEEAKKNLAAILDALKAKNIPALLVGMRASPSLGADYQKRFDAIYPALAESYGILLYPFMLEGVALNPALNLPDGLHPNQAGVDEMARRMLPLIRTALLDNTAK